MKNVNPNKATFAGILKACSGGRLAAMLLLIILHGFGSSTRVCNPIIDLYAKNGFIDSA